MDSICESFAEHADRIRRILAAINAAKRTQALNVHTFHLHAFKGDLKGFLGRDGSGQLTDYLPFENGEASDVDLVDYH